jgi:8-oxo-dGTP pyrophosphatase MutT (NUDIX family)
MARGIRNNKELIQPVEWSKIAQESARFFRVSHLRRLRGCEQVAAVCYRIRTGEIEFLLVQTSGGRWTFPKGSTMPGLTHAQAAALEAFEEAGVHGRIEEAAFARYMRRKRGGIRQSSEKDVTVNAHLCEVSRLESPQEFDRSPTWFSAEEAKRRVREGRKSNCGDELARVVTRAVARIQRLSGALDRSSLDLRRDDPFQKVQFIDSIWREGGKSTMSVSGAKKRRLLS